MVHLFLCVFKLDWLNCCISAQTLGIKHLSQLFKLRLLKECCLWQVVLRPTPLIFLKNISFHHQTEDLQAHRLDWTDCRTLLFLSLSKCSIRVGALRRPHHLFLCGLSTECYEDENVWTKYDNISGWAALILIVWNLESDSVIEVQSWQSHSFKWALLWFSIAPPYFSLETCEI